MKKRIGILMMMLCLAVTTGCAANRNEREILATADAVQETAAAAETTAAAAAVETSAVTPETAAAAETMAAETGAEDIAATEGENPAAETTAAAEDGTGEIAAPEENAPAAEAAEDAAEDGIIAVITVKDYGTIRVALDADAAPISVENFVNLAKDGFYDGLTFHRIINGFMIQGGDPEGTGYGGSGHTITGEFANNGVNNPISHTRGTISMARSQDYNSASSQFFIMQADGTYLDGDYAGFGTVLEGMEIVDQICKNTTVEDSNGTVRPENQPVIESIRIEEPEEP